MENNEVLSALQLLNDRIQKENDTKAEAELAAEALRIARERQPVAVSDFDRRNKQAYVDSHIGREPVKPRGLGKIFRSKMKAYEREFAEYKAKHDECVKAYYQEYAEKRRELESNEQSAIAHDINFAKWQYDLAVGRHKEARRELASDETLSENLKKMEIVDALITFVRDRRADSVKEAVNLYYEEGHRRRLEELAREQVRTTSEALSLAREATERADEAIQRVYEAMRRADAAYEKAEQACGEAQNAYRAATSNSGSNT